VSALGFISGRGADEGTDWIVNCDAAREVENKSCVNGASEDWWT